MMNKLIPAPNCLSPAGCNGDYVLNTGLNNTVNQQTYKLDQNFGKWGSLAFRYTQANYLEPEHQRRRHSALRRRHLR